MNAPAKTAIGAGDDVLPADDIGVAESRSAITSGCSSTLVAWLTTPGMRICRRAACRVAPDLPFVLVAHVAGFDRVGLRLHLQQQVDDVLERDVGLVRAVPASPADVEAHAVFGDALQRMVERLHLERRPLAVAGDVVVEREPPVIDVDDRRIVDLQDEAGVDDGPVFLADRLGERPGVVLRRSCSARSE